MTRKGWKSCCCFLNYTECRWILFNNFKLNLYHKEACRNDRDQIIFIKVKLLWGVQGQHKAFSYTGVFLHFPQPTNISPVTANRCSTTFSKSYQLLSDSFYISGNLFGLIVLFCLYKSEVNHTVSLQAPFLIVGGIRRPISLRELQLTGFHKAASNRCFHQSLIFWLRGFPCSHPVWIWISLHVCM